MSKYNYHIFLSYKRGGAVEEWVKDHFYPFLKKWLNEELPNEPDIYFDQDMRTGTEWPSEIINALKTSRILVPILNSKYFSSSWCRAELDTLLEREKYFLPDKITLIYPIRFHDGKYFSDDIKKRICFDMGEFTSTCSAFKGSANYILFENSVKKIASELAELLSKVPEYSNSWPIIHPKEEIKVNDILIPKSSY